MQDMECMKSSSALNKQVKTVKDLNMEMICQNPKCKKKSYAVKVCHHSDCRDSNQNRPFHLCFECNVEIHKSRARSNHLCFDIPKKRAHSAQDVRMTEKPTKGFNHIHDDQRFFDSIAETDDGNDRRGNASVAVSETRLLRQNVSGEWEKEINWDGNDDAVKPRISNGSIDQSHPGDLHNYANDSLVCGDNRRVLRKDSDERNEKNLRGNFVVDSFPHRSSSIDGSNSPSSQENQDSKGQVNNGDELCGNRSDRLSEKDRNVDDHTKTILVNGNQNSVGGNCSVISETVGNRNFEDASQDDDEEFTDSESLNLKLKRKKAMKIKKVKTAEFLRNYSSLSKIEVRNWKSFSKHDDEIKFEPDLTTNSDLQDISTSNSAIAENQVDFKSTLPSASPTERSSENKNRTRSERKNSVSENVPTNSSRDFENGFVAQDDSRKRKISSSAIITSEYLRKFSLTNEYFTLRFGTDEQMIVAPKGLPLGRAISSIISERWGLAIDQCDVFLNSSNSPLPMSSDCYLLANHTLRLKVKPKKRKSISSISPESHLASSVLSLTEKFKQNGNVKTAKKIGPSEEFVSADKLSNCSSLSQNELQKICNGKAPNKLQSLFQFTKIQDKQEHLAELLHDYSVNGLPKMPDLLTLGRPRFDASLFHLERHWKDIVVEHESLTKPQRDQQEAIWELLTTEVEYIRKLGVVNNLFMCCLFNLQNEQVLNEIEAEKLFSNIDDVYFATCHFWKVHLIQVLRHARKTREPLNPSHLKAGFAVFDKVFEPYTKYCLEQDTCQEYVRTKTKENELLRTYIHWGQSQGQCRLLRLQDILCGPWQRLMRYRLLLKEILKYTEQIENPTPREQIADLENMIEQVEKFVAEVNIALRVREESLQMSKLMSRIESYEVVESPSDECAKMLDKFCKLDLMAPVPGCSPRDARMLIHEGNLKLKDAFSKTDVYCFLFTDMFLVTKPVSKRSGDRVKIVKPPMRLDKIVVQNLRDLSSFVILYLNEYHVAQAVYTFHGDSRLWTENLRKAQTNYGEKRFQNFLRPDNLFADNDENVDDDDAYPAFLDSPSTPSVILSDRSLSFDALVSNSGSESASIQSKSQFDDSRSVFSGSGSHRRVKGVFGSNLSLANSCAECSCDQMALNRKGNCKCSHRKLCLSPSFSNGNPKISKVSGSARKKSIIGVIFDADEEKIPRGNQRHNSETGLKSPDEDTHLQKRLSWHCDANLTLTVPGQARRSKSPTPMDSQQSSPDGGSSADFPAVTDSCGRTDGFGATFDGRDFGRAFSKFSRATFPVDDSGNSEIIEKREQTKAFVLEDCTLEATDV